MKPYQLNLNLLLWSRLKWFGHLEHENEDDWVLACRNMKVARVKCSLRGRGSKTWRECATKDMELSGALMCNIQGCVGTSYGANASLAWKFSK